MLILLTDKKIGLTKNTCRYDVFFFICLYCIENFKY